MRGGSLENHMKELLKEGYGNKDEPLPIIWRVPINIHNRVVDPQAYKPGLVSIGPLHYDDESLLPMQQHKLRFYVRLSERLYGSPAIDNHLKKTVDPLMVKRARRCYSESFHTITDSDFAWMLTLDACFILEVFRYHHLYSENTNEGSAVDEPIFNTRWIVPALRLDLVKMENQLPFFVLQELYNVTRSGDQEEPSLTEYAAKFFAPLLQSANEMPTTAAPDHLLALFHSTFKPKPKPKSTPDHAVSTSSHSISFHESDHYQLAKMTRQLSAYGLFYSGIKISNGNGNGCKLLDIDYQVQLRKLEIPPFVINHNIISIFRNLLAYEQLCDHRSQRSYFTSYIMFLNHLVCSTKDVGVLRKKRIMNHTLVSDDQVVTEIGNLFEEVVFAYCPGNCYLHRPIQNITIADQNHGWRRWRMMLIGDYFNTPEKTVSMILALMGIYLAFIQTVSALISISQANRKS